MRKRIRVAFFIRALMFLCMIPSLSFPQGTGYWTSKKFEFTTATSYEISLLDTSYFHQYSPIFMSGPYQSNAEHTLFLDGGKSWGLSASLAYFPLEKLGVQFHLEFGKPRLGG
ncbi:MAG: hypothetical protein FJY81_05765, partial [Candidatus Aminicenantes bacterium]|nr:hypothetical protein [Candidatus Aminicenantes bacterium]